MEKQKEMLSKSIPMMLMANKHPEILHETVISHSDSQRNITPAMYVIWTESLVEAVSESDPKFDKKIERAWRLVVKTGLDLMKQGAT
jgi:hemoglobin-like flavoprotein